jgi:hypothetical protein
VNIRHEVLDWFEPSREVIALHLVLMHYAIEIDSSIFLSGSFGDVLLKVSGIVPGCFSGPFLDVDLSSLFIV